MLFRPKFLRPLALELQAPAGCAKNQGWSDSAAYRKLLMLHSGFRFRAFGLTCWAADTDMFKLYGVHSSMLVRGLGPLVSLTRYT